MEKIIGTIRDIIYISDRFSIFKILCDDNKEIICVCDYDDIQIDDRICAHGNFEINPKYGERFKVSLIEKLTLVNEKEIEKYLSSSLFVGIGVKTAKKIVEKFGVNTLDIINNDIDKLKEVEGIGNKKFLEIKSALSGRINDKEIILELTKLGFSLNNSNKIYNIFYESSVDVVKDDPYVLIDKLQGFGFKKADAIGKKLNILQDSFNRIKHGIIYVLKERLKFGNTFLPYNELICLSKELLLVEEKKISDVYDEILSKGFIIEKTFKNEDNEIRCVFLTNIYMAEYEICSSLIRLYIYKKNNFNIDVKKEIEIFEKENSLKFSDDQVEALTKSVNNSVHIITGGPGTGKTTIIKFILNVFIKRGFKTIMVAPTGRAAKRMMETTGFEAKTIHRVLEISSTEDDEFNFVGKSDKNTIKCDVIIIDEASMIDVLLGSKLFNSLGIGTKIIIVGDIDQLPSVGPGNFLKDIINSGIFPVSRLNKIYRQKENSYIVLNAHKINNGEELILNKKDGDFYILKNNNENEICDILKELVLKRIPKFFSYDIDILKDIQVLSPIRKGILGVNNLNLVFQESINPKSSDKNEMIFLGNSYRVGDKVMQIKNNYELLGYYVKDGEQIKGVFNGDIGYIIDVNEKNINVLYDGNKIFKYDKTNLSEIEHAYAITVHKSQGSEFPIVIIPIFRFTNILMNRNILYTAVTRAKRCVILVGDINALMYMVRNTSSTIRYSSLKYLFNEIVNLLEKN
ncbi:SF1B family DNA helicase RecD2 [Candidatus Arthromitus sp. SFB-turkey]|uniref:SF1B family DNA helicase RecD2 n=1 Tax=Candidatus Arthromitus sp. SFB-turkey TaxID=1840217 RepID=UPI0007F551DA|nr:ATP-dependent RecD-like DNA helicase [Candidatus Arthromitus sp. SFB-turkey]OAT90006.1 helicase RecD [Candidatus Arthromitus sp. SFB-turkey]